MCPVNDFLSIKTFRTPVFLLSAAIDIQSVTTNWSCEICSPRTIDIITQVSSKLEILQEVCSEVTTSSDIVNRILVNIFLSSSVWVMLRAIRTKILSTKVILALAICIKPERTILLIEIYWVDRCYMLNKTENVRVVCAFITECQLLCTRITEATTYSDVLANLMVNLDTAIIAVKTRTRSITLITEITKRNVRLGSFITTRDRHLIFLTETIFENILFPVVTPLESLACWIEFASTRIDYLVVFHTLINIVVQNIRNECACCIKVGICIAKLINETITIRLKSHFVIFTWIRNNVIE